MLSGTPLSIRKLFDSADDGVNAWDFHRKCDNRGPTLVLLKTYEKVAKGPFRSKTSPIEPSYLGGFTDQSWSSDFRWKRSKKSFIFSLNSNTKLTIQQENEEQAIYCAPDCGPVFGKGGDLFVSSDIRSDLNHAKPLTYVPTASVKVHPGFPKKGFRIDRYQVYALTYGS